MTYWRWSLSVRLAGILALAVALDACGLAEAPSGNLATGPSASGAAVASGSPLASPTPSAVPTQTPVASPAVIEYLVKRGDTLTSIARRFSTSPQSIGYWNRAAYPTLDPDSTKYDPNKVEVGWRLLITPGVVLDEAPEPSGSPQASAEPALVLPPAATPPPDGSGLLVTHGPRASNAVALTFDLGGRTTPAIEIVQWLIGHRVAATIFATGSLADDPTGSKVLALAAGHPDLFTFGNHTYNHPDLTDFSTSAITKELTRAETVLSAVTGQTTKPLLRPPYGAQNATVRAAAAGAGYPYTVMWDVDTIDWKPESDGGPTVDDIVTKVAAQARGGTIVLMHLGGYNTLDALPGIIDAVHQKGLVPVNLGTMLGL